ncbi:alanine racemase [Solibacillus merdavium]|uniref:Alanine racemase n=1 Tax=Solibacillus merdavium TaxID=2762218 RepID=A0ABR8XPC3_9BACL|nr:alanine racemase [Solibacillus merdavium]MBD8033798.1 alanine racemase [Solibacillus merdavium]
MENPINYRPTKAIIDLQAIEHNLISLRQYIGNAIQIIAVVKANAYGHGDVEVARTAIQAGATMLAVATPDEAVHMRENFKDIDILVLGATPPNFIPFASQENIILTVFSASWLESAQQYTPLANPLKLHIKVDSGMGRIGVSTKEELMELYEAIVIPNDFILDGIFTHFATADEEDPLYFDNQVTLFKDFLSVLPKRPRLVHVANTATALVKDPSLQYDAVRFGISMYGLSPSPFVGSKLPFPIKPAFSLHTELIHIKKMHAGQSVGYGATYTVEEDCYIGTIPIGYADGMLRKLEGQEVLIGGKKAKIVGRICMDQSMILLPTAYNVGEEVVLIGRQQQKQITMDDWAAKLQTINYEVPCVITARVPRVYK